MVDRFDDDDDRYRHSMIRDIPEPFKFFYVEIRFEHPYWRLMVLDKKGPEFLYSRPDVTDHLNEYEEGVAVTIVFTHTNKQIQGPG